MSTHLGSNKKGGKTADSSAITRMRKLSTIAKNYNGPSKQRKFPENIVTVGLANASLQTLQNVTTGVTTGVVPTGPPANVTITILSSPVNVVVRGSGTIDWGIGSPTSFNTLAMPGGSEYNQATSGTIRIYSKDLSILRFDYTTTPPPIITSLDVSNCPTLEVLDVINCSLPSLDVSKNTALTGLNCSTNNLTSLDVSKNTLLSFLTCSTNNLTSLDVSKNTALTYLGCGVNKLISLDVSKNTLLSFLECSANKLNSLDVSALTELAYIECGNNELTVFVLSGNGLLTELYCQNNTLTSLDVSQTPLLTFLDCSANTFEQANADNIAAGLIFNMMSGGSLSFENNTPTIDTTTDGDYDTLRASGWTILP